VGAIHLPSSLTLLRRSTLILALFLVLIILAPVPSVVSLPLSAPDQPLVQQLPTTPTSDDLLVGEIATPPLSQQQHLLLTWTQDNQHRHALPLTVLADGRTQQLAIPVGAHPGWRGEVRNVRLVAPYQKGVVQVERMDLVRRSPLAPDLWLLRALHPALPILPPYANVQLFLVAMLGAGMALTLPWSHWRHRLALLGLLLAAGSGVWTGVSQLGVLSTATTTYGTMSDAQAVAHAPAYEAGPEAITQLVAIAAQLPDGPVLLLDVSPAGDLLHRARYLFYPRKVDVRSPQDAPTAIPQVLVDHYVAAIQLIPTEQPPAPGWERIATGEGPLAIWRSPGLPPMTPRPAVAWPAAALPLLGGLTLILVAGWASAGALGWRGVFQLGAAWPLGTALLAWWMWLLDIVGLPWSVWSVGLPLLGGAGFLGWYMWRHHGQMPLCLELPRLRLHWSLLGWALVALLTGCVLVQAVLLPLTDRDSWTIWGLKSQAFFLDGSIEPVLSIYRGVDAHHASYPPAQPLAQTWLYLMMGGLSERLAKAIFPLWYLAGVLLTWWTCRRWTSRTVGLGWALLLATTPLYLDHATLANADLPLAVALQLGGIALACWVETGERRWIVGGAVALSAAAWLKLDGSYLGAGMLLAALLVAPLRRRGMHAPRHRALVDGALALGLFAALVLPWLGYTRLLGLNDLPGLESFQGDGWALLWEGIAVIGAEVLFSYNNSSMGLLGGGYGMFWLVCLGALAVGWRRLHSDAVLWFLLLIIAGGFAFYLAIYTVRPYYSVERYLLHLAPLALLAAARASRGALQRAPAAPPAPIQPVLIASAPKRPAPRPAPRRTRKGRRA
jgi:Dolichyl-phosphate-mannose-protein mannosyltransferase